MLETIVFSSGYVRKQRDVATLEAEVFKSALPMLYQQISAAQIYFPPSHCKLLPHNCQLVSFFSYSRRHKSFIDLFSYVLLQKLWMKYQLVNSDNSVEWNINNTVEYIYSFPVQGDKHFQLKLFTVTVRSEIYQQQKRWY